MPPIVRNADVSMSVAERPALNEAPGQAVARAKRRHTRQTALRVLCIVPPVALLGALVAYPLANAVYLSFTKSSFINPEPDFAGLQNYTAILTSDTFLTVLKNSLIWTVAVVAAQFVLGLASAILLSQKFKGRLALRSLVILPWIMPGVIAGVLWKLLYDPYLGPVNAIAGALGVEGNPAWLGQASTALAAVVIAAIWKGFPLSTIMYMAAYQGVPNELREAARSDGANAWQVFRHVTLPAMAPTIRTTVLLTTVWTFNYFDLVYVMTAGGPGTATEIFPTYIYREAFQNVRYGFAGAYGVISVVLLSIFTVVYLRQLNKSGGLD
jgi:multiple sugar transport system permease protein